MQTRNVVYRVLTVVTLLALLLGSVPVTAAPILSQVEESFISIQVNNPITFTTHVITTGVVGLESVYAADLDNDGDMDVLSASKFDDTVAWYENDGGSPPVYTTHVIISNADLAFWVHAADLDSDGDLDILSVACWGHTIYWHENDGGAPPTFATRVLTTDVREPKSVYAADVDGDGDMDVFSASRNDNKIAWHENDGGSPPSFTSHTITTSANGANSVYAVDMDGDGDIDAVSASRFDDKIAWYENDGGSDPSFTSHTITTNANDTFSAKAADIDGDGNMDVISASELDSKIAWYENDGGSPPNFASHIVTYEEWAIEVHAADVDGDGDMDVLSSSHGGQRIAWHENEGGSPPAFSSHVVYYDADSYFRAIHTADIDSDGDVDVLGGWDSVIWWENTGGGGNEPPTADAGGPYSGDEGVAIAFDGATASDPDGDSLTIGWSVDDALACSFDDPSALHPNLTCSDDGEYEVTLTVDDGENDPVSDSATVMVLNLAPTVTLAGATSANEGDTVGYSYTVSDPGADTFTLISESCGTGGTLSNSAFDGATGAGSFDCTFPDGPATPNVSVTVDDDDLGRGSDSIAVTVSNVDPTIESLTVPWEEPVDINDQASFTVDVSFSDPAGAHDEFYTCDFDMNNDGLNVVEVDEVTGTSCSATLNYATPGVYAVKVTVTDKDGGSDSETATDFIVIYDPAGGFVTGGGWIWSPEGACQFEDCQYNTTGKANFGFVSKYKKGASVPTGNTEFNFKAGDLNFHSSSYDWLVIAGPNAKYKGVGTINRDGPYKFMLTALDADINESDGFGVDRFRIKIWYEINDTESVIYDNGLGADDDDEQATTEIGGGSIVIHTKMK